MNRQLVIISLLSAATTVGACSGTTRSTPADGGGSGGAHAGSGGAGAGSGGGGSGGAGQGGVAGPGTGGGSVGGAGTGTGTGGAGTVGTTQCNDGIDNDNDGRIDLADVECVSPLDNDESSFATGIPGDNMDACKQDCFFDGNSGMGDDGCNWELKCDPANTGASAAASCPYDPNAHNCPTTQSPKCIMNCRAVTPNGCDCFGCCNVPGVNHPVRLDSSCTAANFNDPAKCPVCTQQTNCMNTCGPCQLCLGKTTLDPSCSAPDGGVTSGDAGTPADSGAVDGSVPTPVCASGQTVCGTDAALCPKGTLCVTGCCVPWVF